MLGVFERQGDAACATWCDACWIMDEIFEQMDEEKN